MVSGTRAAPASQGSLPRPPFLTETSPQLLKNLTGGDNEFEGKPQNHTCVEFKK